MQQDQWKPLPAPSQADANLANLRLFKREPVKEHSSDLPHRRHPQTRGQITARTQWTLEAQARPAPATEPSKRRGGRKLLGGAQLDPGGFTPYVPGHNEKPPTAWNGPGSHNRTHRNSRKGTEMGYGLVGLLVIILLVVMIFYFARRA